jgi:succinyl-diaminopimelate desuccinylase
MSATLELARSLVEKQSVTPDDAGCQRLLAGRLEPLGFKTEWFQFGDVSNVLFTRGPRTDDAPSLWFLGHTDVVPPGPLEDWSTPPFTADLRQGVLFGRGVADMKGAVAAMVTAAEALVRKHPGHTGQLGILLTSDEEGIAIDGIKRVAEVLSGRGDAPRYCLVGEPSSQVTLGDTILIGRRGSIHARLRLDGVQGHSAFPAEIDNPIHRLAPFLQALTSAQWDQGDEDFPPTHCQVTNIRAGAGAENVTPGHAELWFNIRNSPVSSARVIQQKVEKLLGKADINAYSLDWRVAGEPFRTAAGELRAATIRAIREELGVQPDLNTGGGTSDGRFMAPLGCEVLEFGLLNQSIHKVDENTPAGDLEALHRVYLNIMLSLLTA